MVFQLQVVLQEFVLLFVIFQLQVMPPLQEIFQVFVKDSIIETSSNQTLFVTNES
ncbi:MAG: hypothetical protein LBQ24_05350 [Candidatus Peribacteria bacterium]|nr:hypothetical protein [Candidatus Peribacteria bacterium]